MMQVIMDMSNLGNYPDYAALCESRHIYRLPIGEFANQVGALLVARQAYPGMPDLEALELFRQEATRQHNELIQNAVEKKQAVFVPCGSCGGGQVR